MSAAKVFPAFTPLQDQATSGFAKNLPLSLRASVFPAKILTWANAYLFIAPETELIIPAPSRHK
ncbi:MAG: hypothetical protein PHY27_14485, partial [Parabacteroides sp.]|nr:hypothetical protein [Parabacteroides sp.]